MAAPGSVEAFMEAEEEASRLVEELARLKVETESYRTARGTLEEAGAGVARLAGELADAAQRLDGVIQTLRTIGTPELLRAQQAATAEVAALRAALAEARSAMDASVSAQRETLDTTTAQLRSDMDATGRAVRSLRGLVLTVGGVLLLAVIAVTVLVLLGARA